MLGGGDADVHLWLVQQGAYSGTMGNVSYTVQERDRDSIKKEIGVRRIIVK